MVMDCKIPYSKNVNSSQIDLWIQHNSSQIPGIVRVCVESDQLILNIGGNVKGQKKLSQFWRTNKTV